MSTPTISVLFQQTTPLGCQPSALIAALQKYLDNWLAPAWAVHATLQIAEGSIPAGNWALLVADDSDQAQALGYHELEGQLPIGFVFVRTCSRAGIPLSDTLGHEVIEMLLDPGANLVALSPRGRLIAREVCDPVQGSTVNLDGFPQPDFVLPAWYGVGNGPFDAAGACRQAWEVLPGGYVPIWQGGRWTQLFGSERAKTVFEKRGGAAPLKRTSRRANATPPRHHDGESRVLL